MRADGTARNGRRGLNAAEAAHVYDRIGRLQDTQAPIERGAVDRLVAVGDLRHATAVFELGCGTGAFAQRLLSEVVSESCSYVGGDVSPRMVALARPAVAAWPERASVVQLDGSLPLPAADASADRFVAAFVFDLLDPAYARAIVADAYRILRPGGLLCLSSLTWGTSRPGRMVSTAWYRLWRLSPRLVGGCRPIELRQLVAGEHWKIVDATIVETWGFPAQVLVAART